MRAVPPIVAPGRGLSLQTLARAGVTLAGRPIAVDGERVAFDGSVAANVAAGDAFAARLRTMVDELIRRQGLDGPTRRTRRPRRAGGPGPAVLARPARRRGRQRGVVYRIQRRLLLA
jgi:hypothetical protein